MALRTFAALILLLLIGYGAVKAWPLVSGPELRIESPTDFSSAEDGTVVVRGVARHTESLMLNGGLLLIDQEGRFEKTLLLPSGGAILSLTATDRFGRSTTERRTVYIP